jgi:hypothetical protein
MSKSVINRFNDFRSFLGTASGYLNEAATGLTLLSPFAGPIAPEVLAAGEAARLSAGLAEFGSTGDIETSALKAVIPNEVSTALDVARYGLDELNVQQRDPFKGKSLAKLGIRNPFKN